MGWDLFVLGPGPRQRRRRPFLPFFAAAFFLLRKKILCSSSSTRTLTSLLLFQQTRYETSRFFLGTPLDNTGNRDPAYRPWAFLPKVGDEAEV